MKHLFVPYEIALKLKEKGFEEPCFGKFYKQGNVIFLLYGKELADLQLSEDEDMVFQHSAPLYQQVIDWFIKKHNIHIVVTPITNHLKITINKIRFFKDKTFQLENLNTIGTEYDIFQTNDCFNKAIEEAIKLKEFDLIKD